VLGGRSLHHHRDLRFALFPRQPGRAPEFDQGLTLQWMGRFIGRIHAVGAIKPFCARPGLDIETFARPIRHPGGRCDEEHCGRPHDVDPGSLDVRSVRRLEEVHGVCGGGGVGLELSCRAQIVRRREEDALLDLRIFASKDFSLSMGQMFLLSLAFFGAITVIPLFLQDGLEIAPTDAGLACSSPRIRALIRQVITAEAPKNPLSASQLSEILGQQGIVVARRTVAKYREALSIPPVKLRKTI